LKAKLFARGLPKLSLKDEIAFAQKPQQEPFYNSRYYILFVDFFIEFVILELLKKIICAKEMEEKYGHWNNIRFYSVNHKNF